jgi:predicted benzoate:H+ symporter BenE
MTRTFSGVLRLGSVVAFVVTLSPFTVAGYSAFWALIAGIGTSLLLERRELEGYWKNALVDEPASTRVAG